jgi:hypothetical protein
MQKVLECEIKSFSLIEILLLVEKLKKTGKIEVVYNTLKGEIYIEEGKCVHAVFKKKEGIDALFEIANFLEGKLSFFEGEFFSKRTIGGKIAVVKEELEKRSYEIRNLEEKLPSLDTVMIKSDTPPSPELTLRKSDWKLLALIDGKKTLKEVIEKSGLGLIEAYKGIIFLKEKGLIVDPLEGKKAQQKLLKYLNIWNEELGGELEEEKRRSAQIIISAITELHNTGPILQNIVFDKEFKARKSLKLNMKETEEIIKKLEKKLAAKLIEKYGKVLAKKKLETIKARTK